MEALAVTSVSNAVPATNSSSDGMSLIIMVEIGNFVGLF